MWVTRLVKSMQFNFWMTHRVVEIERHAVDIARGAGKMLSGHFGRRSGFELQVEFKDDKQRDPVTAADKQTQAYLAAEIARRFPGHGILGEEATEEEKQSEEPARDTLVGAGPPGRDHQFPERPAGLCLVHRRDPSRAARLRRRSTSRGPPMAAASCCTAAGAVAPGSRRSRRKTERSLANLSSVLETEQPIPNRLIGLPGYFGVANRFTGGLAGKEGEPRTTGSIAYRAGHGGTGA